MIENRDEEECNIKNGSAICGELESLSWKVWRKKRYIVAFMTFLGFFNAYSLRSNLSVGIVAMANSQSVHYENGTVVYKRDFPWNSEDRGLVLSSFFWGYITTQLLGGLLASKFGGNIVFGIGIAATSVLTLLTPVAAKAGLYVLMTVRILEGIFEGLAFPATYAILSRWAPPLERSRMISFVFSGNYLGTVISMPVSGILADHFGWQSIFYVFGIFGCIWYIFWIIIVYAGPEQDKTISNDELLYIQKSLDATQNLESIKYPWKDILTSKAVHAIVAAHCAENWGFYTMLTQLPTFLADSLGFNLEKSGFLSAAPYLAMSILILPAGFIADKCQIKGYLTTSQVRRYFNCSSFLVQTVLLMTGAYVMNAVGTMTCIIVAIGLGSFAHCGFGVNSLDIAPQYASVIVGIENTFATIPGIVSPILTGLIVVNSTHAEWEIVFMLAGAIYLIGSVFYWLWASGDIQPWAQQSNEIDPKQNQSDDGDSKNIYVGHFNEGFKTNK